MSSCYGTLVRVAIRDSTCNACHHMVYTGRPSRYRSSDQCILNAFRSPERYNGWFRKQLGQRFTFFNFFPMMTDEFNVPEYHTAEIFPDERVYIKVPF